MKDVFLCHAGTDKAWVRELGARLEAERIGDRRIEVFFDDGDRSRMAQCGMQGRGQTASSRAGVIVRMRLLGKIRAVTKTAIKPTQAAAIAVGN